MNQVFDLKAVLERCDNDKELIKELMDMFIEDYPKTIADLEAAVKSCDAGKIDRSAHAIKSALGNLGGMKAYQAAYNLELSGKKGEVANSSALFSELKSSIDEFLAAWKIQKPNL